MASSGLASTHTSTFLAIGPQLQRTGSLRRTSCLSPTLCQSWSLCATAANTSCRVCDGKCGAVVPHQRFGEDLQLAGKGKKSIGGKVGSWRKGREVQAFAQLAVGPAAHSCSPGGTKRLSKGLAKKIYSEGRDGAKGVQRSGAPLCSRGGYPRSHLHTICARVSSRRISDRVESRIGCRALSDSGAQSGVGVVQSTEPKMQGDGSDVDVEAVLFDMDGVLCDSESRSRQAAAELFHEMGYPDVVEADFVPFTGTGELNFLSGVARKYGVEGFDAAKSKDRFYEIYLEKCKEAGLKIAVASSADRVKVNANLRAASIPIEM
ncbi:hypothetical protein CBR_g26291 [Chara braunii]|uniref:Uncharacterized protein n=1 Tax=Chara braunii TaxID=69332 RepID=A0A388L7H2_CHABU|nr:hypothetical protein CBR_g26291 [Chara braunii]|eukprot:GBG78260.1 hypothetical protein CBR_g26291 [Chara braunii]